MVLFVTSPCLLLLPGLLGDQDFWKVVNLLIFVLVLAYILRNKVGIGRVFDGRAAGIARELDQARREKEEAEKRLEEISKRMSRLDQETAEIRAQAEVEAQREAERIRQAAALDAEKIQQMARREIEGAMKAARAELRAFVAEHSVTMAEGLIRKEIKPDDQSRILSEYVSELGEVKNR